MDKYYAKNKHKVRGYTGTGSGGKFGKDNQNYKHGLTIFQKEAKRRRDSGEPCNHCGIDLSTLSSYNWCGHHIDHNRDNNDFSNLMMLCKRCHQTHHDCIDAVKEGAETKVTRDGVTGRYKRIEAHNTREVE